MWVGDLGTEAKNRFFISFLASYFHSKQIFPEKKLLALSPNFHIQVSAIYIFPLSGGLPILLQENMWTDPGNIYREAVGVQVKALLPRYSMYTEFSWQTLSTKQAVYSGEEHSLELEIYNICT
jgi:hypothetical protein